MFIGLLIRQGPGPTKRSRGTVANAPITRGELTLAVKRSSSAYQWRASLTASERATPSGAQSAAFALGAVACPGKLRANFKAAVKSSFSE
jgi:hypothetical protein